MTTASSEPCEIRFRPEALARCFLVAQVLRERFDEPLLEYAMLGVARASDPRHVVATPLLHGQDVATCYVEASGRNVLKMRSEMAELGRRFGERLVPTCFVHRHPSVSVDPSDTDIRFASEVLINQVSAVHTSTVSQVLTPEFHSRDRTHAGSVHCPLSDGGAQPRRAQVESSVAFSLIVSATGERYVFAVRRDWCPACGVPRTYLVPATLVREPEEAFAESALDRLRAELEVEVEQKITLPLTSVARSNAR